MTGQLEGRLAKLLIALSDLLTITVLKGRIVTSAVLTIITASECSLSPTRSNS